MMKHSNRQTHRLTALMLSSMMAFGALAAPMTAYAETDASGNYEYTQEGILSSATVTIEKCYSDKATVTYPARLKGHKVTEIKGEFEHPERIKSVSIQEGTTTVSGFCDMPTLYIAHLPDTLTKLSGFRNCPKLLEISVPGGVKTLDGVFMDCPGLKTAELKDGIELLMDSFVNCTSLQEITLPDSMRWENGDLVAGTTFKGCEKLSAIHISDSNPYLSTDGKAVFNKDKTKLYMYLPGVDDEEYTIPDSVTEIESGAFCGARFSRVTIPESVKKIGSWAFRNCSSLTSVTIPGSVKTLTTAFCDCDNLTDVRLEEGVEKITDCFKNCKSLRRLTLPDSVKKVIYYSFLGDNYLEKINVSANNPYLCGDGTVLFTKDRSEMIFYSPANTEKHYTLPDETATIDEAVFKDNRHLESVDLNNVTYIGTDAFENSGLKSVVIPKTVKEISWRAFRNCRDLQFVEFEGNPRVDGESFMGCPLQGVFLPNDFSIGDEATSFVFGYENVWTKTPGFTFFSSRYNGNGEDSAVYRFAQEKGFGFVNTDDPGTHYADDKTGIRMVTAPGSQFSVKDASDEMETTAYALSLTQNGAATPISGVAFASIPVDNGNVKVFRVAPNGVCSNVNATYRNGEMVFFTPKDGVFMAIPAEDVALVGDVNGDNTVDVTDATMIQLFAAELTDLKAAKLARADANGDGKIDVTDATFIQMKAAGAN